MQGADTHVTVLPEFIVPEDRFQDFVAGFPKFYEATKVHELAILLYFVNVLGKQGESSKQNNHSTEIVQRSFHRGIVQIGGGRHAVVWSDNV
jgi:hypothetical protein